MNSAEWDERYRASELVWGGPPNQWLEQEAADLPTGRAVDLACGEGRNALWLARRGWAVTALDFSPVAIEKARALEHAAVLESAAGAAKPVDWICADVTTYRSGPEFDLAVICYLHLVAPERRAVVRAAADALAPAGVLVVIGHHLLNLDAGVGGPQDPAVLYSASDLVEDLDGTDLLIDKAQPVHRVVPGADRTAVDALLRAHRPS